MYKLDQLATPNRLGAYVAKAKFKLDGVRYRGKLKAHQWDHFIVS
jgi:hypothetical protein